MHVYKFSTYPNLYFQSVQKMPMSGVSDKIRLRPITNK